MSTGAHHRRPRASHGVVAVAVGAIALFASACGSTGTPTASSTTTTPAKAARLPIATIRSLYLAIVGPSNTAFAKFAKKLADLTPATPAAELKAAVVPAAAAIERAGRLLYTLRLSAPTTVKNDLYLVVAEDNVVWQALQDLDGGWGSRAFDYTGWQSSFSQAIGSADAAGATLRKALGLPVNGS